MPGEIYFSCDVEADGPIPGPHSMLSLGSVALNDRGVEIGCFQKNLEPLEGAYPDPDTAAWWAKQPEAWEAIRKDTVPARQAIDEFIKWVNSINGRAVFVGYPACYDFLFVYWYIRRFGYESPFSHSGLDVKTYAMAVMKSPYRESTKRNMPKRWFAKGLKHTHVPVDDAREQGQLFINMLKEHTRRN